MPQQTRRASVDRRRIRAANHPEPRPGLRPELRMLPALRTPRGSGRPGAAMEALIAALSAAAAVGGPAVADGIAAALQPFLGRPDLLSPEQQEPDPARYRQHLLHVSPEGLFSIVALVWLPGQVTSIHDHLAWCVAGVHRGFEEEVQYRLIEGAGEGWLTPAGISRNATGSVGALTPPGDIHAVRNPGPGLAVSIHVYGVDLRQVGSSIRRRYDQPVRAV